jgi:hypothetical protein
VNDKLPDDVLLEIFDAYRQDMGVQHKVWNSKNGWFRLAHVCRSWRRAVFLSPSRLHVHLLFTPDRSAGAMVLKRLPPLPVLIDCDSSYWTEKEDRLALAAIKHRNRVRGITLRMPHTYTAMLRKLLNTPFPNLESLDFCSLLDSGLVLPATFFPNSASCLRQLKLRDVVPSSLSPVLSFATGLVELSLVLRLKFDEPPDGSLLANLQRMSFLRHLELRLSYHGEEIDIAPKFSPPPASAGDAVTLPRLTDFTFRGHVPYLNIFVAGLAAPALQFLDIRIEDDLYPIFPNPLFCRFLSGTEFQLISVNLIYIAGHLAVLGATRSGTKCNFALPLRIWIPRTASPAEIGDTLSRPLSTVEKLQVSDIRSTAPPQWHGLFKYLPQLKVIEVFSNMVLDVARAFQLSDQKLALDLLPALEQIKIVMIVNESDNESICSAFKPLIAAWQRVGRHVELTWP